MSFPLTKDVEVRRDPSGAVRQLRHLQRPYLATGNTLVSTPRGVAAAYLRDVESVYGFPTGALDSLAEAVSPELVDEPSRLRTAIEKRHQDTTTIGFQQTHLGLPVWKAGVNVHVHEDGLRVTSSQSTVDAKLKVAMPSVRAPFLPGLDGPEQVVAELARRNKVELKGFESVGLWVFRYDQDERTDPRGSDERLPLQSGSPTLRLSPPGEQIQDGRAYVVHEVRFVLDLPHYGDLAWRAFLEVETGVILFLRAGVHCASGNVFEIDPETQSGDSAITACSSAADLNPYMSAVLLHGLDTPAPGADYELSGEHVVITDSDSPAVAVPTSTSGNFTAYNADTDEFSAVNAYHHLDSLFRLLEDLGFDIPTYFSGTTRPIPVDHRGEGGSVNAHHYGLGGSTTKFTFGLASAGCDVGIAADKRVVAHEFAHSMLENNIGDGAFSWAHGVGDSLAAILYDPGSNAGDRHRTFPWNTLVTRRHDRDVASGWAWGGSQEDSNYQSTEILSSTLFRAYQSTGGGASGLSEQEFASRYMAYLICAAVGAATSTSPPASADDFATLLMEADEGTTSFEGHPGGAFHKVIRWAFEKQGLYQPAGAPVPVASEGAPPEVDVYIDDGRDGEYDYLRNFWSSSDIWNRLSADGGTTHETPVVGVENHLYVKVKNRGSETAENVTVKAFHCEPATGLVWPDDWTPLETAELTVPGGIAAGAEVVVGPFTWIPEVVGHECVLASVDADGDPSNADTVAGSIPHRHLVPFDNNIGQRNLVPVASSPLGLVASFEERRFTARNPFPTAAEVDFDVTMPAFLEQRGWELQFANPGGKRFTLGARESRGIVLRMKPGSDFSKADVRSDPAGGLIEVVARAKDIVVGGMTYRVDPRLEAPPRERSEEGSCNGGPGGEREQLCERLAERLTKCLELPDSDVSHVKISGVSLDIRFDQDC